MNLHFLDLQDWKLNTRCSLELNREHPPFLGAGILPSARGCCQRILVLMDILYKILFKCKFILFVCISLPGCCGYRAINPVFTSLRQRGHLVRENPQVGMYLPLSPTGFGFTLFSKKEYLKYISLIMIYKLV